MVFWAKPKNFDEVRAECESLQAGGCEFDPQRCHMSQLWPEQLCWWWVQVPKYSQMLKNTTARSTLTPGAHPNWNMNYLPWSGSRRSEQHQGSPRVCTRATPAEHERNWAWSVAQGASTIALRPWKQQNKGRWGRLLLLLWARIQIPFSLGPAHLFPPAMSCSDPLHIETSPHHWKSLEKWSCVRTLLCMPSSSMPSQA